jgi:hypothetical protein
MSKRRSNRKRNNSQNNKVDSTLFEANPPANKKTEETDNGENKTESDEGTMLQNIYNKIFRGKAAAWTAIFTCVLMVFSGLLWKVASDANNTSVETQRAFLSYSGPQITKDTEGFSDKLLKGVRTTVFWVNSGTTPTKAAIMESNLYVGPDTAQSSNFDNLSRSAPELLVIGPKAANQTTPVQISSSDLEEIEGGARHAFVWGFVAYYDIFPNTPIRLSEYCTQIDHPVWTKKDHKDATGEIHFDTPPCPVHNCYDDGCKDYSTKAQQLAGVIHR